MKKDYSDYNQLLSSLKNEDREAFDYLYQDSRVWLYVIAFKIIEEEEAARDLVQDFFIDFWQQKIYHQVTQSLKGYLITSITHKAYNFLDKKSTRQKLEKAFNYPADKTVQVIKMEQEQLIGAIRQALTHVPQASAQVFTLHYISGLTHAQIAEQLEVSPHTVRNHITKALKILRSELKNIKNE